MRKKQRLDELQKQWDLLSEKLSALEQDNILETRSDEKLLLKHKIAKIKAERQEVEQQLNDLETQLSSVQNEKQALKTEEQAYEGVLAFYLEKQQEKLLFKSELVDQNILPVFIIKIDLSGIRERHNKSRTFTDFQNEIISSKNWNAIIIGEAGIGKTTELLRMTKSLSFKALRGERNAVIPIYVELRYFSSETGNADDVTNHIMHITGISEQQRQELLEELKQKGQFLIIFDGLNEIESKYRSKTIDALIDFMKIYSSVQYILSTRYYGFDEQFMDIIGIPMNYYEIQRWNNEQIKLFFQKNQALNLYQKLDIEIQKLCSIPFIAYLLLNILQSYQYEPEREYPENKGELYKSYIEYIFSRRDPKKIENKFSEETKSNLLATIAYIMNKRETLSLKCKSIEKELRSQGGFITNNIEANNIEVIEEIIANGILRKGGKYFLKNLISETPIEFMHQSIQEYFTALYISMKPGEKRIHYFPMDDLENVYWRDVPIYLAGLLENPLPFIDSLIKRNYLLTAAQCLVSCKCESSSFSNIVYRIIEEHLINSIQQHHYTKDAIEIVGTLGQEAINLLLSHLEETEEIIEVKALTGNEDIEKKWRKYGRIIYILGELNAEGLIEKLKNVYKEVKDTHLLYHIVIALYTMKYDDAINSLQDDYLRKHEDPVIRTFSLLGTLERAPHDRKLNRERKELIPALTHNLNIEDEMAFAIRAHSAEALGLLGMEDAIEPLADLLEKERRPEPQSSAIKALGYIAYEYKQEKINSKIIDILINSLESENINSNEWGIKHIKELLSKLCVENEIGKLHHAIERIEDSCSDESVKLIKIKVLNEVIQSLTH